MRTLCALAIIGLALPAGAQDILPFPEDRPVLTAVGPEPGEWMFGLDIGFSTFHPEAFKDRGTRFAVVAERQFHRWVGLQADVNCARGTELQTFFTPERAFSLCIGSLNAVVPVRITPRLWPYAKIGVGTSLWDLDSQDELYNVDARANGLVLGWGARYFVGEKQVWAVRVDVQRTQTALYGYGFGHWSYGIGLAGQVR
jgi:opacity protein-like surface antigen